MAPYIFMERNGIHIIDLYKTVAKVDEAAEVMKNLAKQGKKVLFGFFCRYALCYRTLAGWYVDQLPDYP